MTRLTIALVALMALLLALPAAALAETPAPPVEEVTPDPGATGEPGGSADPGVTPDPGGETSPVPSGGEITPEPTVDVSLPPAIDIRGVVRNVDGTPAEGAAVYAEVATGTTSAVSTDASGAFALLVYVEPGTLVRIDAQGPSTEIPGDDAECRYFAFALGIVEVEAAADGVAGVEIVLDQEGRSAVCAETGGPNTGGEAPQVTLPPTDAGAALARPPASMPGLALLLAMTSGLVLVATARRGSRRA